VALLRIFRDALAETGRGGKVMASDMSRLSSAALLADRSFLVPSCTSPAFIPAMLEICRANDIGLVIPTIDTELPAYASNRTLFSEIGTTVAVSSPEVVSIGGDKEKTHAWLVRNGFPAVRQARAEDAAREADSWVFPLVVKPRFGSSSIGVAVAETSEQLQILAEKGGMLAQEIARGIEFTVDVFADCRGRCACAVPRKRLEVRGGEVSKAMTVRCEPLMDLACRICDALPGAYGALNIQMFLEEETRELKVIEINPRFGGGFPLTWEAGGKFPRWMLEECLGLSPTASDASWRDGLVMLRYDDAVFAYAGEIGL
jgi:carbamoyl-phosphate synthase large subunit